MKNNSYDQFFSNFSNRTRMEIVSALAEGPLTVGELVQKTKGEQSNVSHNLKKLLECNILTVQRKGKCKVYSLNKETVIPILKLVERHVAKNCCVRCAHCAKQKPGKMPGKKRGGCAWKRK